MRQRLRPLRLALLGLLASGLAAPGEALQVPAAALSVAINGEELSSRMKEADERELHAYALTRLAAQGFVVLRTADPERLIGGGLLADRGLARLEIGARQPSFTFRVLLLPKVSAASLKLVNPLSGGQLWEKTVKVHSGVPEGKPRREAAVREIKKVLDQMRPRPGLPLRSDPFLAGLLALNDATISNARFIELARGFASAEKVRSAAVLVELAADPRTASAPELSTELLRRAVVADGPRLEPVLARALLREARERPEGSQLTDLLVEGFQLIGASPGDALAPSLLALPLDGLLAARARYAFRNRREEIDRRIERLAIDGARAAPDFASAEDLVARLPLERFSAPSRAQLRDELLARVTLVDAEGDLRRIARLFPGTGDADEFPNHIDQGFLDRAARLAAQPAELRLELYRDYLRCVPRGRASEPLLRALRLEKVLEAELRARLASAPARAREEESLQAVYGPQPGPSARAAMARILIENLGPSPDADALLALEARHPELDELHAETRRLGAVRDGGQHVFEIRLGDDESRFEQALGRGGARRGSLNRRDLSPTAYLGTSERLPALDQKGYFAFELAKRYRVLFKDGRVFRIVISDLGKRYHHGVRPGDTREQALAALGQPSSSRAMLFSREVLSWKELDGPSSTLHLVLDSGKIAFLIEEDTGAARELFAALR